MNTEQAIQAAENTRNAFSHERYGHSEWTSCALVLGLMGYSQEDAERVLRSKIMRWSADLDAPTARSFFNWVKEYGTRSALNKSAA